MPYYTSQDWGEHPAVSDEDFAAVGYDSLVIPAGQTGATIDIGITDDSTDEYDDTFRVILSWPENADIVGDIDALGTITDDDAPPLVTMDDITVAEDTEMPFFTFSLSAATDSTAPPWTMSICSRSSRTNWATCWVTTIYSSPLRSPHHERNARTRHPSHHGFCISSRRPLLPTQQRPHLYFDAIRTSLLAHSSSNSDRQRTLDAVDIVLAEEVPDWDETIDAIFGRVRDDVFQSLVRKTER